MKNIQSTVSDMLAEFYSFELLRATLNVEAQRLEEDDNRHVLRLQIDERLSRICTSLLKILEGTYLNWIRFHAYMMNNYFIFVVSAQPGGEKADPPSYYSLSEEGGAYKFLTKFGPFDVTDAVKAAVETYGSDYKHCAETVGEKIGLSYRDLIDQTLKSYVCVPDDLAHKMSQMGLDLKDTRFSIPPLLQVVRDNGLLDGDIRDSLWSIQRITRSIIPAILIMEI